MSWARGPALIVAVAVAIALAAGSLSLARLRQMAADEARTAEARSRVAALGDVQKRVDEYDKQKAEYQARVDTIARLRATPAPQSLTEIATAGQSAGVVIEEMAVAEMTLTVAFRAPAPEVADRFGREVASRSLVANAAVQRGKGERYSLRGVLLPRPASPNAPPEAP